MVGTQNLIEQFFSMHESNDIAIEKAEINV